MISDISDLSTSERYFYLAAIDCCKKKIDENVSIKDAVEQIISEYQKLTIISDFGRLRKALYEEVSQVSSQYNTIKSKDVKNRNWWTEFRDDTSFPQNYWTRYYDYLSCKTGWSRTSIDDLDKSTDEVMNALANPRIGKADERRGLVYGDVQSGKTAHYIGIINKAYSAGYKIIIVLTGMQNSLRSQTQSRIDEEVLGYETSSELISQFMNKGTEEAIQNSIGVAKVMTNSKVGAILQSLTNRDNNGDFNKDLKKGSFIPPYIIVTKKIKTPLQNILKFLSSSTIAESENGKNVIPAKYPALIIDDEADQASINTKDEKSDPTTINGLIRKIISIFKCKSYIGYTATPFANIFIPHRTEDDIYGKDLFPKDFIACAPRPNLYIGAQEFFGLGDDADINPMPLWRPIDKGRNFLAKGKDENYTVSEIPDELKQAVKCFLISTAVRNLRGQQNKPNTMLVHIIRLIDDQRLIKRKLEEYKNYLFDLIEYGDTEICSDFEILYNEDYIPTAEHLRSQFKKYMEGCSKVDFEEVWNEIIRIVKHNEIEVWTVNSQSKDGLIYKNHQNTPFNVIAIGGDKLSRGLTLEGLTISYFTRAAGTMDTLMQMGRWFGYRPGYLDLCRLFTTEDLFNKFEIISYSVANLIAQFDDMNLLKADPEHFGLKVAMEPSILISARNKVRTGSDYKSDFSGVLTQTRLLDADSDIIVSNYEAVDNLLSSLDMYRLDIKGRPSYTEYTHRKQKAGGKTFWIGVPGRTVSRFFKQYHTSKSAVKASSSHIADYIDEMLEHNGLIDWTICLAGTNEPNKTSVIASRSAYPIWVHGITRNKNRQDSDSFVDNVTRDLHVLTSAGDEELDYLQSDLDKAYEEKEKLKKNISNTVSIAKQVRIKIRDFKHGFLLLYPIEQAASDLKTENHKAPYAFAVVFPDRKGVGNLRSYKLNEVAVEMTDDE